MTTQHVLNKGQAMITVIFIAVIGILIATGAIYALLNNIHTSTLEEVGTMTHAAAESGIENALIRLIRDPAYGGETLQLSPSQTIIVSVTGSESQTITSTATEGSITKRIVAVIHYNRGVLVIDSWNDLP